MIRCSSNIRLRGFLLLFAALNCTLFSGCEGRKNELVQPAPPAVTVASPLKQEVTLFVEQSGVTEAAQTAEVRARVRGYIQEVAFKPGEPVGGVVVTEEGAESGGTILYRIERTEYEAAYNAAVSAYEAAVAAVGVAEAQVRVAQAAFDQAQAERDRQTELKQRGVNTKSEFDAAIAAFKSSEANLSAAKASVELAKAQAMQAESSKEQAKLDLDYTVVRAPIDGQVSKTMVKLGNLVEPGTQLAVVTDSREVFVNFSVSDREALRYLGRLSGKQLAPEGNTDRWAEQQVYLAREIDDEFQFVGTLDYVDQTGVDAATGTLGLRAKFDNSDRQLLPGLFVKLRLPAKERYQSILVPDKCILRTSRKTYVLTVEDNNTVSETEIVIGERVDGWVAVADGLDETALVIVEGIQKARQGDPVSPTKIELVREAMWGDAEEESVPSEQ